MNKDLPFRRAAILIEYGPVEIGGSIFVFVRRAAGFLRSTGHCAVPDRRRCHRMAERDCFHRISPLRFEFADFGNGGESRRRRERHQVPRSHSREMLNRLRSSLRTSPGCRSIRTEEFLLAISQMKPHSQQPRKVRKRLPPTRKRLPDPQMLRRCPKNLP